MEEGLIFEVTPSELEEIEKWKESLPEGPSTAIGGRFKYVFTPTGVGVFGTIIDSVTGQKFEFCDGSDF